jgi:hypothetical protein
MNIKEDCYLIRIQILDVALQLRIAQVVISHHVLSQGNFLLHYITKEKLDVFVCFVD